MITTDDDLEEKLELLHVCDSEEINSKEHCKQEQSNQVKDMFPFEIDTSKGELTNYLHDNTKVMQDQETNHNYTMEV